MNFYFDSHCHLQDERLRPTLDKCIERARNAGVAQMLCCGSEEADWEQVLTLSREYPFIISAAGVHPWYASRRSSSWRDTLTSLLRDNPRCAVGEIGLDHALHPRNDDEQLIVFKEQMQLACELNRPVSVHCRKAWGSLLSLLREGMPIPEKGMVIHSYSGSVELLTELSSYGISFSFSGAVTYVKNARVRRALAAVNSDRLLIETDSPDIAPHLHNGYNEPSTLPLIAAEVARIRGVTIEKIAAGTTANALAIYAH